MSVHFYSNEPLGTACFATSQTECLVCCKIVYKSSARSSLKHTCWFGHELEIGMALRTLSADMSFQFWTLL